MINEDYNVVYNVYNYHNVRTQTIQSKQILIHNVYIYMQELNQHFKVELMLVVYHRKPAHPRIQL